MRRTRWFLVSAVLTVMAAGCGGGDRIPAEIARSETPVVHLDPAGGPCGKRVTVAGGGFAAGETVLLALFPGAHDAPPAGEPLRSFSVVRLNDDGTFRTAMRMGPEEVAAELCATGTITLVATTDTAMAVARYEVE
ncbi:MAG: hypothetical protein Kow0010_27350 [Dehalococcoidia bacterium]